MHWYYFSLIALLCYGTQYFFYKVSAERKCNTAWTSASLMVTVAGLAAIFFFATEQEVVDWHYLLFIAVINALAFFIITICRIEALKHLPASVNLPIVRTATVLVVIFSIFYFHERPSLFQGMGIVLAMIVVFILINKNEDPDKIDKNFKLGIILSLVAMAFTAIDTVIVKVASENANNLGFMAVSGTVVAILSLATRKKFHKLDNNPRRREAIVIGFLAGVCNFIGFYSLLKALAIGPLSIISPLNGMSFLIVIGLSIIFYKEKLTVRRMMAIVLGIAALILLKF